MLHTLLQQPYLGTMFIYYHGSFKVKNLFTRMFGGLARQSVGCRCIRGGDGGVQCQVPVSQIDVGVSGYRVGRFVYNIMGRWVIMGNIHARFSCRLPTLDSYKSRVADVTFQQFLYDILSCLFFKTVQFSHLILLKKPVRPRFMGFMFLSSLKNWCRSVKQCFLLSFSATV